MRLPDQALINEIIAYAAAKTALADEGNNKAINDQKAAFFGELARLYDNDDLNVQR